MSRRSTKEYILRKRDDYLGETQRGKHRMLDEICKTVGLTRKYVIKLLSIRVAFASEEEQRQCACRGKERVIRQAVVRGNQARLPGAGERPRRTLRDVVGLPQFLLSVQDACLQDEAHRRQREQERLRQAEDTVPEIA